MVTIILSLPDCENTPETNCTTFNSAPDATRDWSVPSVDPLDAIFTVPGEELVGVFNRPVGASSYSGTDAGGSPVTTSEYFRFYSPATPADALFGTSALPGELFSLGTVGTSYTQESQAAETASDGGGFIVCPANPSENCQLFARGCSTDQECAAVVPGTRCKSKWSGGLLLRAG